MNKPLNVDDELFGELRMLYKRRISSNLSLADYLLEMRQLILADRKKHELQAKKNGFYMAAGLFGADISRVEELWDKCEKELEKL